MIFAVGYLVMMALFECEYLPALFLGMHFSTLCLIFRITAGLLSLCFAILGAKGLKDLTFPKMNIYFILFLALVTLECVARWFQGVTDGDDAFFLGTAVNSYFGNTMYTLDPYTGFSTGLDVRHALSPGGVFLAYLANCLKLHPAITAHIIFADLMIILHNIVFYRIGTLLFSKEEKYSALFADLVCVFDVFGNISLYTPATFLITRTWQGKSVIANFCIPFAFLLFLIVAEKELTNKQWKKTRAFYALTAAVCCLGAVCMATTGLVLLSGLFVTGSVVLFAIRKKPSVFVATVLALVPVGLIGVLFAILF